MDVFIELRSTLAKELERTGYRASPEPPIPEPELPRRLRGYDIDTLVDLVDDFQTFYNYLSDQIAYVLTFEGVTKARVDLQAALAKKAAMQDKRLTNESARAVEAETDDVYLEAVSDYLFFKQDHAQLEERRRKISKSIDRLYRELMHRDSQEYHEPPPRYPHHSRGPLPSQYGMKARRSEPDGVQPKGSQSGVQGKVDVPASQRQQDVHQDQERVGGVQGDEGVSASGGDGVVEADSFNFLYARPKTASPYGTRPIFTHPVQLGFSEEYDQPVPQERRVKPSKGRRGSDGEDAGY